EVELAGGADWGAELAPLRCDGDVAVGRDVVLAIAGDHDHTDNTLHPLDTKLCYGTATIGERNRLADLGHGILKRDVAVCHTENVPIVGLQVGHEQVALLARPADFLMTGKRADTFDA